MINVKEMRFKQREKFEQKYEPFEKSKSKTNIWPRSASEFICRRETIKVTSVIRFYSFMI